MLFRVFYEDFPFMFMERNEGYNENLQANETGWSYQNNFVEFGGIHTR
jgi:hypothetical protein